MEEPRDVVVANIDSDGYLWLRIGNEGEFRRFQKRLALLCSQPGNPIVSPIRKQTFRLLYVDFGDSEVLPLNCLYPGPLALMQPLPFAKKCWLHGVDRSLLIDESSCGGWTEEAMACFESLTRAGNLTAKMMGLLERRNVNLVSLYSSSSPSDGIFCVNEELVKRLSVSESREIKLPRAEVRQKQQRLVTGIMESPPLKGAPRLAAALSLPSKQRQQLQPKQPADPDVRRKLSTVLEAIPSQTSRVTEVKPNQIPTDDDVFVFGADKPTVPIRSIAEMPFSPYICQRLKALHFRKPTPVQAYTWRPIFRGANLVAVSPSNSGKTLAYLLPLLTAISNQKSYEALPLATGPLVIILSPYWETALFTYSQVQCFSAQKQFETVLLYGSTEDESDWLSLLRGCDVLVSTPHCLLKALKHNYTNLMRICHLVFDDADVLTEKFTLQIREVLHELGNAIEQRHRTVKEPALSCQRLLFSSTWTPAVESLVNACLSKPLIVMASKFYAAIYWKIKQVVHCASVEESLCAIAENLLHEHERFLVVTCSEAQAKRVEVILKQLGVSVACAVQDAADPLLRQLMREWTSTSSRLKILVVREVTFQLLQISNASAMIHVDFPTTRRIYTQRMMAMKDAASTGKPCVSHLILTEESYARLPLVVEMLRAFGHSVDEELKQRAKEAIKSAERTKRSLPISKPLLAFGHFKYLGLPDYRQAVWPDLDSPSLPGEMQLPSSGLATLKILHVEDASCFWARLLDFEGRPFPWETQLNLDLQNLQFDPSLFDCEEGVVCAWKSEENACYRVEIKKLTEKGEIKCFLIDHGSTKLVDSSDLFQLPAELRRQPRLAVRVFLCGIQPTNYDKAWTPEATEFCRSVAEGQEMKGNVALALKNTLFLTSLAQPCKLEAINVTDFSRNVKRILIKEGFAESNPKHLRILRSLAGSLAPQEDETVARKDDEWKGEVESVSLPEKTYVDVFVCEVETPQKFHVQLIDNLKNLNTLVKELSRVGDASRLPDDADDIRIGSYCLARFADDGLWYRARVQKREGLKFHVYYIDYGDTSLVGRKRIRPIKPEWLELPIQAVECSLSGIESTGVDWSLDAGDLLWNVSRDKTLVAEVKEVHASDSMGAFRYEIDLYDTSGDATINISQQLIDAGFAVPAQRALNADSEDSDNAHWSRRLSALCLAILKAKTLDEQMKLAEEFRSLAFDNMKNKDEMQQGDGLTYLLSLVKATCLPEKVLKHVLYGVASLLFNSKGNCEAVYKRGDLQSFLNVTSSTSSSPIQFCCLCIVQCFLDIRGVSDSLREDGGLKNLCALLSRSDNPKVQRRLCIILNKLCSISIRNIFVVFAEQGVKSILRIISLTETEDDVKEEAASTLKILMNHPRCRDSFRAYGGIPVLSSLLETSSKVELVVTVLQTFAFAITENSLTLKALIRSGIDERLTRLSKRLGPVANEIPVLCSDLHKQITEGRAALEKSRSAPSALKTSLISPQETLSPSVQWWQTSSAVFIKVLQRDVHFGRKKMEFGFSDNNFSFEACVVHNKKFILDLDLYSAIVPEVSRAERGGCLFELAKEKKGEAWPRLLKSKAKMPYIQVNYDQLSYDSDIDDTEEENKTSQGIRKEDYDSVQIIPAGMPKSYYSSDESESDSDGSNTDTD
ncbi:putative ATP-dependent RNA helicase TDRD12 [Oscarella lobularis]|uniref:putative ATP-dependent RNA helicase TDRD12 n=1 Tax=Oscarella lobularis TaxID=121494 RepID=UPI003313B66F